MAGPDRLIQLKRLPAILLVDNHSTHFLEIWELCRKAGLVLDGLPANTTSKTQPLDQAVFRYEGIAGSFVPD